jgi:hypothetical protein
MSDMAPEHAPEQQQQQQQCNRYSDRLLASAGMHENSEASFTKHTGGARVKSFCN